MAVYDKYTIMRDTGDTHSLLNKVLPRANYTDKNSVESLYTNQVINPRYMADYNNGFAINSVNDAVFNAVGKEKRWGGTVLDPSNPLSYLASIPVDLALTAWDYGIKPVVATTDAHMTDTGVGSKGTNLITGLGSGIATTALNSLQNLGETLDVLNNPIKGLAIGGLTGLKRATIGDAEYGRKNYDWDTGNFATNMVFETVSDPLNWVSFGAKAAATSAAKGVVKSAIKGVASETGEAITESTVKKMARSLANASLNAADIATTAERTVGQKSILNKVASVFGGSQALTKEASDAVTQNLVKELSNTALDSVQSLSKARGVYNASEGLQKVLTKSVGLTSVLGPALVARKGIQIGMDALDNNVARRMMQEGITNLATFDTRADALASELTGASHDTKEAILSKLRTKAAEGDIANIDGLSTVCRSIEDGVLKDVDGVPVTKEMLPALLDKHTDTFTKQTFSNFDEYYTYIKKQNILDPATSKKMDNLQDLYHKLGVPYDADAAKLINQAMPPLDIRINNKGTPAPIKQMENIQKNISPAIDYSLDVSYKGMHPRTHDVTVMQGAIKQLKDNNIVSPEIDKFEQELNAFIRLDKGGRINRGPDLFRHYEKLRTNLPSGLAAVDNMPAYPQKLSSAFAEVNMDDLRKNKTTYYITKQLDLYSQQQILNDPVINNFVINVAAPNSAYKKFILEASQYGEESTKLVNRLESFARYKELIEDLQQIADITQDQAYGLMDTVASRVRTPVMSIPDDMTQFVDGIVKQADVNATTRLKEAKKRNLDYILHTDTIDAINDVDLKTHTLEQQQAAMRMQDRLKSGTTHDALTDIQNEQDLLILKPELMPTLKPNQVPLFLDIETTGDSFYSDELLQLAVTFPDGTTFNRRCRVPDGVRPDDTILRTLCDDPDVLLEDVGGIRSWFRKTFVEDTSLPTATEALAEYATLHNAKVTSQGLESLYIGHNLDEFDMPMLENIVMRKADALTGSNILLALKYKAETHDTYKTMLRLDNAPEIPQVAKDQLSEILTKYIEDVSKLGNKQFAELFDTNALQLYDRVLYNIPEAARVQDPILFRTLAEIKRKINATYEVIAKDNEAKYNALIKVNKAPSDAVVKSLNPEYPEVLALVQDPHAIKNNYDIMSAMSEDVHGQLKYGSKIRYGVDALDIFPSANQVLSLQLGEQLTSLARTIKRTRKNIRCSEKLLGDPTLKTDIAEAMLLLKEQLGGHPLQWAEPTGSVLTDYAILKHLKKTLDKAAEEAGVVPIYKQTSSTAAKLRGILDKIYGADSIASRNLNFDVSGKTQSLIDWSERAVALADTGADIVRVLKEEATEPAHELVKLLTDKSLTGATQTTMSKYYTDAADNLTRLRDYILSKPSKMASKLYDQLDHVDDAYSEAAIAEILQLGPDGFRESAHITGGRKIFFTVEQPDLSEFSNAPDLIVHQEPFIIDKQLGYVNFIGIDATNKTYADLPNTYSPGIHFIDDPSANNVINDTARVAREQVAKILGDIGFSDGTRLNRNIISSIDDMLPEEISARLLSLEELDRVGFFNKPRANQAVFGSRSFQKIFNPKRVSDPIRRGVQETTNFVQKDLTNLTKYVDLCFNDMTGLQTADLFKDLSAENLYQLFKNSEDAVLVVVEPSTKTTTGYILRKIPMNNAKSAQLAKELNAHVVSNYMYLTMTKCINDFDMPPVLKLLNGVAMTYKCGYLSSLGFLVRNLIDSSSKNLVTLNDPLHAPRQIQHLFQTFGLLNKYDKVIDLLKESGEIAMKGTHLDFNMQKVKQLIADESKFQKLGLDAELFELVHGFIMNGPSAGMAKGMQEMLESVNDSPEFYNKFATGLYKLPGVKQVNNINGTIEQACRLSLYMQLLENGKTMNQAIQSVIKTHFDYSDRTLAQVYTEMIIPFMSFSTKNLDFWATQLQKRGWLATELVHLFKPVWDFDSLSVPNAEVYRNYDYGFDWENELSFNSVAPWQQISSAKLYHTLTGNIKIGLNKKADYYNPYSAETEQRDLSLVFKLSPSFMDAVSMLTNPLDEAQQRLLPPYETLFNMSIAALSGEDVKTQLGLGLTAENLPFIGTVLQRTGLTTSAQKDVLDRVSDTGSLTPLLSSVFTTMYTKNNKTYMDYKGGKTTYLSSDPYYKHYYGLKYFSGLSMNYQGKKYKKIYDGSHFYSREAQARQVDALARPSSIRRDLYTKSGTSKLKLMFTDGTRYQMMRRNLLKNRLKDMYYYTK